MRRPDLAHQQLLARRGDAIRRAMDRAGLSQTELARSLGVTQGNLAKVLAGERPGERLLPLIAKACGVPVGQLKDPRAQSKAAQRGTRRLATGRALGSLATHASEAYALADVVADRVVQRLIIDAAGLKSGYKKARHEVVVLVVPKK